MIIKKIRINNFGKIQNMDLEMDPGINVLYGENESGKTTIHTFLKSMFFGVSRLRGRGARTDTYSTYEPWNNPADYGGTVWFDQKGKSYRLTRNFEKNHPVFELFCEDDGTVSHDEDELAALLSPVSEAVYDNTVSVGQLKSVTGKDLVRELQNYMASYEGTGDTSLDLGRASQMLKMARKGYQVQADRRRRGLLTEEEKLDVGAEYLEKELGVLQQKSEQLEVKRQALRLGENGGEMLARHIAEARTARLRSLVVFSVLAIVCVLAGIFLPDIRLKIAAAALGIVFLVIGIVRNAALEREVRKRKKLRERWMTKNKKVRYDKGNNDSAIDERRRALDSIRTARSEIEEQLREEQPEDEEIEALNLAMETIAELSGNKNRQTGRRLEERTSEILSEITGGKYTDVLMDEEFNMSVNTSDRVIPLEKLSRGTLEQIYFSLRMAAGELFCGDEPFPVILDDIFGMYDEERLAGVLRWLYQDDKQIIISTCSRREMEILEEERITYQGLLLS